MMKVFLSYSGATDRALAEKLSRELSGMQMHLFLADHLPGGHIQQKELIEREAATSDAFVFLVGSTPEAGRWQQVEWFSALRSDVDGRKPMVLVRTGPHQPPPFLRTLNALDATEQDPRSLSLRIENMLKNPELARNPAAESKARDEWRHRLKDIESFAAELRTHG